MRAHAIARGGGGVELQTLSKGMAVQIRILPEIYFGHEPSPHPWRSYIRSEAGHFDLVYRAGDEGITRPVPTTAVIDPPPPPRPTADTVE